MSLRLGRILARMRIRLFLMANVLQYSMPRTGSTLIRRILYSVFPDLEQPSQHPPFKQYCHEDTLVISCRHPLDVLLSLIRVDGSGCPYEMGRLANGTIKNYLTNLELQYDYYFKDLKKHRGNKLKLKYEKFWNNYDYVFDNFETFFGIKIDKHKRNSIAEECGIENSKKIQAKLKNFDCVDNKTKIHGNHIVTPEPFGYRKVLTGDQIDLLKHKLHDPIQEWKQI